MTSKTDQKKAQLQELVKNLKYLIGDDEGTEKMKPVHLARIFLEAYYAEPLSLSACGGMLDPAAADNAIISLISPTDGCTGRGQITDKEAEIIREAITSMVPDLVVDPPAALCDVDAPTDTTWYKAVACDEPGAGSPAPAPSKLLSQPIRLATNKRKAVEAAQAEAEAVEAAQAGAEAGEGRSPRAEPRRRYRTRKPKHAIAGLADSLIKRGLAPDEASVLAHRFLGLLGLVAPSAITFAELKSQASWSLRVGRALVDLRRSLGDTPPTPELIEKLICAISDATGPGSPENTVRDWMDAAIAESDRITMALISAHFAERHRELMLQILAEVARGSGRIVECKEGLSAAYEFGEIDDAVSQMRLKGDISRSTARPVVDEIQYVLGLTGLDGADQEPEPELHIIDSDDEIDDGKEHECIVIDDEAEPPPRAEEQTMAVDIAADLRRFMESVDQRAADRSESAELLLRLVPCGPCGPLDGPLDGPAALVDPGTWLRQKASDGVTPIGNHASMLGDIFTEALYIADATRDHEGGATGAVAPEAPEALALAVAEFSIALYRESSSLFLNPSELTAARNDNSIESALAATGITQEHKRLILGAINRIARCHDKATGAVPYLASLIKNAANEANEANDANDDDAVYLAIADTARRACIDSCSGANRLLTREHIDAAIGRGYLLHGLQSFIYSKPHTDSVLRILNLVTRAVYRPSQFTPHVSVEDYLFPVSSVASATGEDATKALYASLTRLMYRRYHNDKRESARSSSASPQFLLHAKKSGTRRLAHETLEFLVTRYSTGAAAASGAASVPFPLTIRDLCSDVNSGTTGAVIRNLNELMKDGPYAYTPAFLADAISDVTGLTGI